MVTPIAVLYIFELLPLLERFGKVVELVFIFMLKICEMSLGERRGVRQKVLKGLFL